MERLVVKMIKKIKGWFENKKALLAADFLGDTMIKAGILILILIGVGIIAFKFTTWGDFIRNLFRFGR